MRSIGRGQGVGSWLRHRWVAAVATVLVATAAVPAVAVDGSPSYAATDVASVAPDDVAAPSDVLPAGRSWTVTLLTGHVFDVRSDGEGRVTALPRDHTARVRTVQEPDGDLYAIPLSVTPLVERVLDLELFNLTGLIRQGYDDGSTDVVPLIVQRAPGTDVDSMLAVSGDERPLPSIGAVATDLPKADAEATGALLTELDADTDPRAGSAPGDTKVWLDRRVTTQSAPVSETSASAPAARRQASAELDGNLVQVGADRAWAAGLEGDGITVAVLDTGIDAEHPDLAGKVVAEKNFSVSPDAEDRIGHGTHVASIVAGTGAAANGARRGVAPEAELLSGKVIDDFGFGSESEVIAGMEWAAPQADIVNLSLGASVASDGTDPLSQALDVLSERHGTLFVVAAGNDGPLSRSVSVPGAADRALTVGAVDGADALAEFSSRGPLPGSYELKPEVVAPGVGIVAARASGTELGDLVGDRYVRLSGTSMATPHVAGAAALLQQRHPDWSATELKDGLVASADPVDGDGYAVGAGRIDIADGIDATLRSRQDVVDLALPHPRTEPTVATITWTNGGEASQTVHLDAELEDRQGAPVDAVTITPRSLTLAPGATGTATLEVDGPGLDDGLYSGTVVADPEGDEGDGPDQDDLRTPIAVHAASETAELTIRATVPAGIDAPPSTFAVVVNLDDYGEFGDLLFFEDTTTVTVPVGRYSVVGDVGTSAPDSFEVAQVGDPDLTVTGDSTVTFDGAAAVPFDPTVAGNETAQLNDAMSVLTMTPRSGSGGFGLLVRLYSFYPLPPLYLTPMEADPEVFAAFQIYRLQAPHITARAGRETVDVTSVKGRDLTPGTHTLRAVDAADGSDLTGARGAMAVVQLPLDGAERAAVTRRAADAGVAALAFVDEQRPHMALFAQLFEDPWSGIPIWGDIPVVGAAGPSSAALRSAAARGRDVTISVQASPYVYDIVSPLVPAVETAPAIDRAEQRRLATLEERFHRDPDGTGATDETRFPFTGSGIGLSLWSQGPLPRRRTAHVTPDVGWESAVLGPGLFRFEDDDELFELDFVEYSVNADESYDAGSRTTFTWLRRPTWPGPVGEFRSVGFCDPRPVSRTATTLRVWLAPFQDGANRFGCAAPREATLTLERDGTVIGRADANFADFTLPADPGNYRLSYQQAGAGPYPQRSTTTWTFPSAAPDDPDGPAGPALGGAPVPLLTVDYDLPLDTLNHPTGRTATFTVDHVAGTEPPHASVRSLRVWTSTDDGTTWRRARVHRVGDGTYEVTLPSVRPGTRVSLKVDARTTTGSGLEQTLHDAYTG